MCIRDRVLVAALGATASQPGLRGGGPPVQPWMLWTGLVFGGAVSIQALRVPSLVTRLASPLRWLHADWVDARLAKLTMALGRFANAPGALASSAAGAIVVQALLVAFYAAVARGLHIPVSPWHLAVMVPVLSLIHISEPTRPY